MGFRDVDLGLAAYPTPFARLGRQSYSSSGNIFSPPQAAIEIGTWIGFAYAVDVESWEIRNYNGTVIASGGAIPASTGGLPIPPGLAYGWYRVYFFGSTGNHIGGGAFIWTRSSPTMPNPPVVDRHHYNLTRFMTAFKRMDISNPASPSSGEITNLTNDLADYTTYVAPFDTARPKPRLLTFPNPPGTGYAAGVSNVVATYPQIDYWEGQNEPGGTPYDWYVPNQQTFYNAVKAGNPAAKVLGPCPVSITANALYNLNLFFSAGGGNYIDVISFHTYNAHMGDLVLGRRQWDAWIALLATHGQSAKPRANTEAGGFFACEFGAFAPMRQAQFTMLDLLLNEQYGVQKESWWWFYDQPRGFASYPSWITGSASQQYPAGAMLITHSQELWGTAWEARHDFGTIDNDFVIGSSYRRADSTGVVSVMTCGKRNHPVTYHVTGGSPSTLVVVDCWGNETSVAVAGGLATVSTQPQPTYVRMPAGVTLTPVATGDRYGASQLSGATIACSSGSRGTTDITSVLSGTRPNWLIVSQPNEVANNACVWQSAVSPASAPQTITVTLAGPSEIAKILVECPAPWQYALTAIQQANVDALVDGVWQTVGMISETPYVSSRGTNSSEVSNAWYESFSDEPHTWELNFPTVTATAIRLVVSKVTFGGAPSYEAFHAFGGVNSAGNPVTAGFGVDNPRVALHRLRVFGPATVGPPAQEEATTVDFRLLESGEVRMNENGVDPARITGDAARTEAALTVRIDPDDLRNALGL